MLINLANHSEKTHGLTNGIVEDVLKEALKTWTPSKSDDPKQDRRLIDSMAKKHNSIYTPLEFNDAIILPSKNTLKTNTHLVNEINYRQKLRSK